jgi:replication fork protection complex subunit Csm3/Swi3
MSQTSIYEVHVTDKNAKSRPPSVRPRRVILSWYTHPKIPSIYKWRQSTTSGMRLSNPNPLLISRRNPVTSEDPLFLQSDSDNEGGTGAAGSRPPSKAPDDIGALFDVDDDDENGQLSNVTYEQLRKDARSGGKVPDDGPSNEGNEGADEDPSKATKSKSNKKDEDGDKATTKRTIPKLDEGLLLGEKGIPALIKDAKQWRPKGKGHEVSFFDQSFQVHLCGSSEMSDFGPQSSHQDVPILGSPDVPTTYVQRHIERVEKLTHSRRMHVCFYISCRSFFLDLTTPDIQVALSVWHDEARGISRYQAPPEESIDIDGINSDEEEGQAGAFRFRTNP